jgi:hypothetical protein
VEQHLIAGDQGLHSKAALGWISILGYRLQSKEKYTLSVTREMVNLVISEHLSKRASAEVWGSSICS